MTSAEMVALYLRDMARRGLSPNTIRDRRFLLARWVAYLDERHVFVAVRDDVSEFVFGHDVSPRHHYHLISYLHAFYEWAIFEDHVDVDPTVRVRRPKFKQGVPRPIGQSDLDVAMAGAESRMHAWLALAAYAGLRCCEIAGLAVDDLLLAATPVIIVTHAKGGKERIVPLADEVLAALRRYGLPRSGFVFTRRQPKGSVHALSPTTISRGGGEYLHGLGMPETMHSLRHFFGTGTYAESKDLRLVQELLGHAHPNTTARYVRHSDVNAAQVVARLASRRAGQRERLFDDGAYR